jgi:hypothetical protein
METKDSFEKVLRIFPSTEHPRRIYSVFVPILVLGKLQLLRNIGENFENRALTAKQYYSSLGIVLNRKKGLRTCKDS